MGGMTKPASTSHGVPGTAPRYTLLFRTVLGSRMHGFDGNDLDIFEVWDDLGHKGQRDAKRGGRDVVRLELDRFLQHLHQGVPRAVEARYAPDWAVEYEADWFRAFRHSLVPGTAAVAEGYRRTVDRLYRNVADGVWEMTPKRARQASRLEHDRHFYLTHGWLDPTAFARTPAAHNLTTHPTTTSTKELHHA